MSVAGTSWALDVSALEQTLDIACAMNDANDFDAVLDRPVENQMPREPLHPKHPGLGKKRVAVGNGPPDAWQPSDEPS